MSTTWLHVQSFFADAGILRAINDLSIALKLRAAGAEDAEWKRLGHEGRRKLEEFLKRVIELGESETGGVILGVDPRTQSLVHSLGHSPEAACGASPRVGISLCPQTILALLQNDDPCSTGQLLPALRELYQVILAHQQQDADVLFPGQ
jgi:hypothetical protein